VRLALEGLEDRFMPAGMFALSTALSSTGPLLAPVASAAPGLQPATIDLATPLGTRLAATSAATALSAAAQQPKHLADALALVDNLNLDNTSYEHGTGWVNWVGTREAYVDCSGLINNLLEHSYGYDRAAFTEWFGVGRPTAADYHDAIVDENGFTNVASLRDVRPGDLLAVKYAVAQDKSTGHIMLVAGAAREVQPGQWEVPVIDSALSGHGPTDTRHGMGEGGADHDGVGRGIIRIDTDQNGAVLSWRWSTSPTSAVRDQSDQNLVIGRFAPENLADPGFPITAAGEHLATVLDGMDVENHWLAYTKLQKPDVDGSPVLDENGVPVETSVTHCDAFVKRACDLLGAPMTAGEGSSDHANQQYDWLDEQSYGHDGSTEGWYEVTALQAQNLANQGQVVVAACRNNVGHPGHVAMVRPSLKGQDVILAEGPQITQAGQVNYNSTSVAEGFAVHPGAWGPADPSNTPVRFFCYQPAS
jgi:hypothetical protein